MSHDALRNVPRDEAAKPTAMFQQPPHCPLEKRSAISLYEAELERHRPTEAELRQAVIREAALLRQKDDLIQQKDVLGKESEHRLLNGLQLITSLLTIQSRATKNDEAAAQLKKAAHRVAILGRVHQHLHALDHIESVEFKKYLATLCCDLSEMTPDKGSERVLVVEGMELEIPTVTAVPLGFIASELVTNSIKSQMAGLQLGWRRLSTNAFHFQSQMTAQGCRRDLICRPVMGLG